VLVPDAAGYPLPTLVQTALSVAAFFLPLMLYATWSALAFADLGRRQDLSTGARVGWVAAILLLPWIGAALYHLVGRSTVAAPVRTAMLAGGVGAYLLILLAGRVAGGIS
jgi:Phospholipase_D-nuclease N-terminal